MSEVERLMARVAELEQENAALRARVEALERRLGLDSSNSSRPPSSDAPWKKRRGPGRPKGKRRGGQPGHMGQTRAMVPPDQVDHVKDHRPPACERCGALLLGADPEPVRMQVSDLPPARVEVTEHRIHRLPCLHCGHVTRGVAPPEAEASAFGPRVHGMASWMTGRLGLSKRDVLEVFEKFHRLQMSPGSVSLIERRVARALSEPYQEACQTVRGSPVVHPDETTWYEGRRLVWLWTGATSEVMVFLIQDRRNAEAAQALLGVDFAGAACTDRHGAYNWLERRGLCWAHLLRNFTAMAETPGGAWHGQRLAAAARRVITVWHRHDRGEIDTEAMRQALGADRRRIASALRSAAKRAPSQSVRRQATALLAQEPLMWTFTEVEGMPPTNNLAERAVRRGVLWRKRSSGTDSPAGSRFVERILTVVESLRAQQRDVVDFLTEAYVAHLNQQPAPSLLPTR